MDIINKLRREAAERSNEMMAEMLDNDTESIDDITERVLRKRGGGYLSRLDEDSALNDSLLSPSRHLTRRSISRELFGGGGPPGGVELEQRTSSAMSPTSSISGSRPVTRRSISRELFDYPPSSVSGGGRITPTYGLVGSSPARRTNVDYTRSSRERSLGRDGSNDYNDRSSLDRTRSNGLGGTGSSRRSESLTRGGASSLSSQQQPLSPTSYTSRPSLSTQGRSLTQNEFIRTSPRSSVSGRLSAGIEDENKIRSGISGISGGSSSLNDRGRTDWRRVSVPERGKDYSTLQSKYKR